MNIIHLKRKKKINALKAYMSIRNNFFLYFKIKKKILSLKITVEKATLQYCFFAPGSEG